MLELQKIKKTNFGLKEDIYELNQKNYHLQKALHDSQNDSFVLAMNKVNKSPLQQARTTLGSATKNFSRPTQPMIEKNSKSKSRSRSRSRSPCLVNSLQYNQQQNNPVLQKSELILPVTGVDKEKAENGLI
jgi:hypothetical protein